MAMYAIKTGTWGLGKSNPDMTEILHFFVWSVTENEYNKCLLEKYTATIIFRSYLAIDCLYEHNFCIDVALDDVAKEDNLLLTINNRAEKYTKFYLYRNKHTLWIRVFSLISQHTSCVLIVVTLLEVYEL